MSPCSWQCWQSTPRLASIDCIATISRSAGSAPRAGTFLKTVDAGALAFSGGQSSPCACSKPLALAGLTRSVTGGTSGTAGFAAGGKEGEEEPQAASSSTSEVVRRRIARSLANCLVLEQSLDNDRLEASAL